MADGDVDLADQYAQRLRESYPRALRPTGAGDDGRLHEPQGVGLRAADRAGLRARRPAAVSCCWPRSPRSRSCSPRCWRGGSCPSRGRRGGAALAALSPPALAARTAVDPELRGRRRCSPARRCARWRVRERAAAAPALGGGADARRAAVARAAVPRARGAGRAWALVPLALRERRRAGRAVAVEVAARPRSSSTRRSTSALLRRPHAVRRRGVTGDGRGVAARLPRARAAARRRCGSTATTGCCAGRRCSRSRSSPAGCCGARGASSSRACSPARREAEAAASLALAVVGAQLLVAAFLVPRIDGNWFAARSLAPALPTAGALVAWGLRHAPRPAAVLGALSLGASAWVLLN